MKFKTINLDRWVVDSGNESAVVERETHSIKFFGLLNQRVVIHNNLEGADSFNPNEIAAVFVRGSYDFGRIRITTSDPAIEYFDKIFYPDREFYLPIRLPIDFPKDVAPVIDISIYGRFVRFEVRTDRDEGSVLDNHPTVKQYESMSPFRDLEFQLAPEPHSIERLSHIYSYIASSRVGSVLDLSAGSAPILVDRVSRELALEVSCSVHSEDELRRAGRSLKPSKVNLNQDLVDLNQLAPSYCADYDVIVLSDVLEHLLDPRGVLQRIHSRMKSGSKLVLTVPSLSFNEVFSSQFADAVGHKTAGFSLETIGILAESSGLKLSQCYQFGKQASSLYRTWYSVLKLWQEDYRFSLLALSLGLDFLTSIKDGLRAPKPEADGPSVFAVLEKSD